jgi:CspA family cold shock protein
MKGTVKFFNRQNRFGFIAGEDGKEYFVHESALEANTSIDENDEVTFDVEEGDKGPKAVNVKKG